MNLWRGRVRIERRKRFPFDSDDRWLEVEPYDGQDEKRADEFIDVAGWGEPFEARDEQDARTQFRHEALKTGVSLAIEGLKWMFAPYRGTKKKFATSYKPVYNERHE